MSDCLYLSDLDGLFIDSCILENIAVLALEYGSYFVFSASVTVCNNVKESVQLEHGVDVKFVVLGDGFPKKEASAVLGFLLGYHNVNSVCLSNLEESTVNYQNDYFINEEFLNCYDFIRKYSNYNANYSSVNPVFYRCLKDSLTSILNLCEVDVRLMTGSGFLMRNDEYERRYDTDLDCISLKDFIASKENYLNAFSLVGGFSSDLVAKKVSFLSMFESIVPSSSSNIPSFRGYPSSYKVLSVYFDLCCSIKKSISSLNSAFLYAFRSLEVYCDGLLISQDLAYIDDYYNNSGELKRRNTFMLKETNRPVMGFGTKWGLLRNSEFVINNVNDETLSNIDKALLFRNKFNLTHGDLKIHSLDLELMQTDVSSFISAMDSVLQQNGFEWGILRNAFSEFISYDTLNELKSLMANKFSHEFV